MSGHLDIRGASALVTGATGGLGQAIARELASRGARVTVTGRKADVLEPLAQEIGGRALVVDLVDRDDVERLIAESSGTDVVVANAALPGSGALTSFEVEHIDRVLEVNLRTPIVMARRLAPGMVERRRGHLVFISSLSGKAANAGGSMYSATKFGLRGFALGLRGDLVGKGVGCTVVNPGFIRDAGMFHDSGAKLPRGVGMKTPQDVARAVARAIEEDPAELDVAPRPLKAGASFAAVAPGLADTIARKLGADRVASELAAGQASKR